MQEEKGGVSIPPESNSSVKPPVTEKKNENRPPKERNLRVSRDF